MPEHRPSWRTAILAAVIALAAATAACTADRPDGSGPTASGGATSPDTSIARPTVDPDRLVRARAVTAERSLLREYRAALTAHPQLRERLAPVVAHHEAHLAALTATRQATTTRPTTTRPTTTRPTTTRPTTTAPTAADPPSPKVAPDPATAVRALIEAERDAAAARVEDAVAATDDLAPLLASIGGSESAHAAAGLAASALPAQPVPAAGGRRPPMTELDALQRALAAEHAAVYGYGLVGAELDGDALQRAQAGHAVHLARRDRLSALVRRRGGTPTPAAPAYDPPGEVSSPAEAAELAVLLEERLAAASADLVGRTDGEVREIVVRGVVDAAVRASGWRGSALAFPGLPLAGP